MGRIGKRRPGEFELIARLCAGLPRGRRTILGPGDDCAILRPGRRPQLFTIDTLVEDVHFKLSWGSPQMLGARALTVNLSDIAAMGGSPLVCVVNLAVRDDLSAAFFTRLYAGVRRVAKNAGVDIVGGNIARAGALAITIALLGELRKAPLRRDTAQAGDDVFVTGTVGDAAVGLRLLQGGAQAGDRDRAFLVRRFLLPTARLHAGAALAALKAAPAAIDLSDGLLQDLGHVLELSGVGAEIDATRVPLSPAYRRVMGQDRSLALSGGEDYELLFCLKPGHSEASLSRRLGIAVRRVGRVVGGSGITLHGAPMPKSGGWDQLLRRG